MYSLGSQNSVRRVSKKCLLLSCSFPPQSYSSEVITFSSCLCVLLVAVSLLPGTVVFTWGCLCLPESIGQYQETFLPVMNVGVAAGRLWLGARNAVEHPARPRAVPSAPRLRNPDLKQCLMYSG